MRRALLLSSLPNHSVLLVGGVNSVPVTKQMEEYLATIYRILSEDPTVRVSTGDVARALGVSSASATYMFKRLAKQDLVDYEGYSGVALTQKGFELALRLIRAHRVTERFLMDHLRFPWHEVDALAHELEHSMPPVVVDRMDELLGFPLTCPHGHPIPRADGTIMYIPSEPLRAVEPGSEREIASIDNDDPDLLRYLASRSLVPGQKIKVKSFNELDLTMCVSVEGTDSILGERIYDCITVRIPGREPEIRTASDMLPSL